MKRTWTPPWLPELLHDLASHGWTLDARRVKHGGQAAVRLLQHADGRRGVLRTPAAPPDEQARERFAREIRILTDPRFAHPGIVRIFEASRDPDRSWYVSEMGDAFTVWWMSRRNAFHGQAQTLAYEAIAVIRLLIGALAPLHENGVVHRDIKTGNLVVSKTAPSPSTVALIDFGLAYSETEERLSSADEIVGNQRFSADPNLIRSLDPKPWLDVFQLAQLLIWMVQSPAEKAWPRPLDWRYVRYDPELPPDLISAFRAVTAQCSEPAAAPHDARALGLLLGSLLPRPMERAGVAIDVATIEQARARGNAAKLLEEAGDRRIMEAWLPRAQALATEVIAIFREVAEALEAADITSDLGVIEEVVPLDDTFIATLTVDAHGQTFGVRAICVGYVPSHNRPGNRAYPPEGSGAFAITISRYGSVRSPRPAKPFPSKQFTVSMRPDGGLIRHNNYDYATGQPVITESIRAEVFAMVNGGDVWEALARH